MKFYCCLSLCVHYSFLFIMIPLIPHYLPIMANQHSLSDCGGLHCSCSITPSIMFIVIDVYECT